MMISTKKTIFFDIGDTLASARTENGKLVFDIYPETYPLLEKLDGNDQYQIGLISNTHRGDESADERATISLLMNGHCVASLVLPLVCGTSGPINEMRVVPSRTSAGDAAVHHGAADCLPTSAATGMPSTI